MVCIIIGILFGALFSQRFARKHPSLSITVSTCVIALGIGLGLFLPTNYTNRELVLSARLYPVESNTSIYVVQNGDWINLQIQNDRNHIVEMKIRKDTIDFNYSEDVEPSYRIYKQYPKPSIWSFSLLSAPRRTYELCIPSKNSIMQEN